MREGIYNIAKRWVIGLPSLAPGVTVDPGVGVRPAVVRGFDRLCSWMARIDRAGLKLKFASMGNTRIGPTYPKAHPQIGKSIQLNDGLHGHSSATTSTRGHHDEFC